MLEVARGMTIIMRTALCQGNTHVRVPSPRPPFPLSEMSTIVESRVPMRAPGAGAVEGSMLSTISAPPPMMMRGTMRCTMKTMAFRLMGILSMHRGGPLVPVAEALPLYTVIARGASVTDQALEVGMRLLVGSLPSCVAMSSQSREAPSTVRSICGGRGGGQWEPHSGERESDDEGETDRESGRRREREEAHQDVVVVKRVERKVEVLLEGLRAHRHRLAQGHLDLIAASIRRAARLQSLRDRDVARVLACIGVLDPILGVRVRDPIQAAEGRLFAGSA